MEQTIYVKYSNERAKQFCIRTEIVTEDDGQKRVYKYAVTPEAQLHIARLPENCRRLRAAYADGRITFCPCEADMGQCEMAGKALRAAFPFLSGVSLQDMLGRAVEQKDTKETERILHAYIRRVSRDGGVRPFVVTEAFERVFGTLPDGAETVLRAGAYGQVSAQISDIDMILSNLFLEEGAAAEEAVWQAIDYEWTFDFPIPKGFLLYRGLYFAYYQVLYRTEWSLKRLFELAGIAAEEAAIYQRMEEHFQSYMGGGTLPVRNMQRLLGTRILTPEVLRTDTGSNSAGGICEAEWLHVKKIRYQIDRTEYQDGSCICSGWAFAATWDGRYLPVAIRVTDTSGRLLAAEISRRERADVAEALHIRRVTHPVWGFDCVWVAPAESEYKIYFSLGKKECMYQGKMCR